MEKMIELKLNDSKREWLRCFIPFVESDIEKEIKNTANSESLNQKIKFLETCSEDIIYNCITENNLFNLIDVLKEYLAKKESKTGDIIKNGTPWNQEQHNMLVNDYYHAINILKNSYDNFEGERLVQESYV